MANKKFNLIISTHRGKKCVIRNFDVSVGEGFMATDRDLGLPHNKDEPKPLIGFITNKNVSGTNFIVVQVFPWTRDLYTAPYVVTNAGKVRYGAVQHHTDTSDEIYITSKTMASIGFHPRTDDHRIGSSPYWYRLKLVEATIPEDSDDMRNAIHIGDVTAKHQRYIQATITILERETLPVTEGIAMGADQSPSGDDDDNPNETAKSQMVNFHEKIEHVQEGIDLMKKLPWEDSVKDFIDELARCMNELKKLVTQHEQTIDKITKK